MSACISRKSRHDTKPMTASRTRKRGKRTQDALLPRLWNRPIESLLFLLPFILVYELGCLFLNPAISNPDSHERIVAFHLLQLFFQLFGSTGVWMPGLAIVIILLCTQAASKQPWSIRKRVVGLMYVEAEIGRASCRERV